MTTDRGRGNHNPEHGRGGHSDGGKQVGGADIEGNGSSPVGGVDPVDMGIRTARCQNVHSMGRHQCQRNNQN